MARRVKVATVSMALEVRRLTSPEDNLEYIEKMVDEISSIEPDLIALGEHFPGRLPDGQPFPSDESKKFLSRLSSKYRTYLGGSINETREGKLYNTLVLFDRRGKLVGRYDKVHPAKVRRHGIRRPRFSIESELKEGVVPGKKDQLPIDTELGKIGGQICFDANWPDNWERQVACGAELIIFSSAFPGGRLLNALALLNQVFIVSSTDSLDSQIIDNTGRTMVTTDRFSRWVWAAIDLERTVFHWDYQGDKVKQIKRKYGEKVKVETFGPEALFTLEPASPEISIPKIIEEFGLITCRDYIKRCAEVQDRIRKEQNP